MMRFLRYQLVLREEISMKFVDVQVQERCVMKVQARCAAREETWLTLRHGWSQPLIRAIRNVGIS
jgi:hypothetical protein